MAAVDVGKQSNYNVYKDLNNVCQLLEIQVYLLISLH